MAALGEIAEVVKCQKTSPYMKLLVLLNEDKGGAIHWHIKSTVQDSLSPNFEGKGTIRGCSIKSLSPGGAPEGEGGYLEEEYKRKKWREKLALASPAQLEVISLTRFR
jgi:hypothetical protein